MDSPTQPEAAPSKQTRHEIGRLLRHPDFGPPVVAPVEQKITAEDAETAEKNH